MQEWHPKLINHLLPSEAQFLRQFVKVTDPPKNNSPKCPRKKQAPAFQSLIQAQPGLFVSMSPCSLPWKHYKCSNWKGIHLSCNSNISQHISQPSCSHPNYLRFPHEVGGFPSQNCEGCVISSWNFKKCHPWKRLEKQPDQPCRRAPPKFWSCPLWGGNWLLYLTPNKASCVNWWKSMEHRPRLKPVSRCFMRLGHTDEWSTPGFFLETKQQQLSNPYNGWLTVWYSNYNWVV